MFDAHTRYAIFEEPLPDPLRFRHLALGLFSIFCIALAGFWALGLLLGHPMEDAIDLGT
jgi:hypothetical protein